MAAFNVATLVGGDVCLFSDSTTDVLVDTFGWSSSANGLRLKAPERVLDTRNGIWSIGPARSGEVVGSASQDVAASRTTSAAALLTVTIADSHPRLRDRVVRVTRPAHCFGIELLAGRGSGQLRPGRAVGARPARCA